MHVPSVRQRHPDVDVRENGASAISCASHAHAIVPASPTALFMEVILTTLGPYATVAKLDGPPPLAGDGLRESRP
jgi:hypothetical protein